MGSTARAYIAAASIGVVEALKDQGIARWNYTIRSVHQYAKNNLRSYSQAKKLSSPSAAVVLGNSVKKTANQSGRVVKKSHVFKLLGSSLRARPDFTLKSHD